MAALAGEHLAAAAGSAGCARKAICEDEGMLVIAHAGHWLTTIAYFVPVVAFLGWLIVTQVRDRRRNTAGREREQASP